MEQNKTSSLLNELKSHPDKSLFNHIENVGNLSKKILESKILNLDNFIDAETLKDISYLIGITHDFGKATKFFQEYIKEYDEKKKGKLKNKPETHHAFLSSLFTYYVVKEYVSRKNLVEKEFYKYFPIISFFVVKKHHGNLNNNASDETYYCPVDDNDENFKIIKKQIDAINFNELNAIYKKLCFSYEINISDFKDNYNKIVDEINTKQKRLIRKLDDENTLFYYFTTLLLYSVLLDADKTDAGNLKFIERRNIPTDVVDNYKNLKFRKSKNKIDEIRENIYNEVVSSVNELNLANDKILSLNVPTGTGKILTSLSFALKLRERLRTEKRFTPRIIYSLPFLSIIDQNSDVFNDVLDNPTTDILLKHHHLSDIIYKIKNHNSSNSNKNTNKFSDITHKTGNEFEEIELENEFENVELEKDIGKSLLLIEGWNSEVIVTTFMQFFHSFITNINRAIRKFHNISNSIVILDEVQTIPHKYWLLLKEAIKFFAEYFNTYFIFVTATEPLIFDEREKEIKSLIKNKEKYFKNFDRVDLIPNLTPLDIEKFKEELKKDIFQNPDKDFLVVMNTIDSSKKIYNFIKSELDTDKNTKIYYLSTSIVPTERLKRIKEIKEKTKERKIIISTQLIEAGVDIDVDVVYRDFAPFDSINQIAGRCNRNFRNFGDKKGQVKIFVLTEKEKTKKYCSYIYDSFITTKTNEVFKKNEIQVTNEPKPITEPKFLELNNSYFEKVKSGMSDDESNKILKSIKKLNFEEISKFKLIEEDHYKVDVFVEVDDKAKEVIQKYNDIRNNDKLKGFEKKNEFLKIKKDFYDYIISVDEKKAEDLSPLIDNQLLYVSNKDLKDWYKPDTGFDPS
ncbi:MAG: CRISPR-associated helicase Cas3', partial [Candidatus Altarchaeum sp.]|nr:CRISPR-associated helicase Cas3' [Candidatus Altarchaeum sp.]